MECFELGRCLVKVCSVASAVGREGMIPWECFHIVQTLNSCFGLFRCLSWYHFCYCSCFCEGKMILPRFVFFRLWRHFIDVFYFVIVVVLACIIFVVVVVLDEEEWFPKNVFRLLKLFTVASSHLSLLNCHITNVQNISEENHQNGITMLVLLPIEDTLSPPWRSQLRNVFNVFRIKTTSYKYEVSVKWLSKVPLITENKKISCKAIGYL